ncbi:MAG: hypothetical protein K5906_02170, partial [Bacilli bacterium]|nr:hypothetical protein [Bacilli bacterium]
MSLTRKINLRAFLIYLGITLFSLLFTFIYYQNSYGMTDNHLTYLFVPSATISLLYLFAFIFKYNTENLARYAFNMSFPFLYIYMMLMGIYTIAKTSSSWISLYVIIAIGGFVTS